MSPGGTGRSDSRRIAIGMVALTIVSVALLNCALYQGERGAMVERRWDQLARVTEHKRAEVRELMDRLRRQTVFIAAQPALDRWAARATAGTLTAREREELHQELDRTVHSLDLHHIVLTRADGTRLAASHDAPAAQLGRESDLARRAIVSGEPVVGDIRAESDGEGVIEIATIVPAVGSQAGPVLVSAALAGEALESLLDDWAGSGVDGHAYLVRADAGNVEFLTPSKLTPVPGGRTPMVTRSARAAAMAASGVESKIEVLDEEGHGVWASTRTLPELGWGLVGETWQLELDPHR